MVYYAESLARGLDVRLNTTITKVTNENGKAILQIQEGNSSTSTTFDACILAVGAIIQKPIVKGGEIAIGNMMKVTLSCDHRVVDGATGSGFL